VGSEDSAGKAAVQVPARRATTGANAS